MGTMLKVVVGCAAAGVLAGLAIYADPDARAALEGLGPKSAGVLAAMADPQRGCHPSEGSTLPFPATGAIPLSPEEAELAKQPAGLNLPEGTGRVALANEDESPVSVLFVGEDGRPIAKAFVRGSQVATLSLPSGAYDAMYESGADWRAGGFGACARKGKVKGVVVAQPGKASQVVLFGDSMFVLGNRMELAASERIEADDKRRRDARGAVQEEVGAERPARERSLARQGG